MGRLLPAVDGSIANGAPLDSSAHTRTALTMLGIVVGIAPVVAVVGLGEGGQRPVLDQTNGLGVSR